jgi:hypothetical protein
VTPPEVEQFLKIDKLRREVDATARRSVLQLVGAIGIALVIGYLAGRYWR